MNELHLLQAFQGTNTVIPVWFMRQAGRYLPEYRALRKKYSLKQMFTTPTLACHVTCLPVKSLKVDAAILFADILTLPSQMGFHVSFTKNDGPRIKNPLRHPRDIKDIHAFEDLAYIHKTIQLVNQEISHLVPLIGFAGGPFTVATYLIEGGSPLNFSKTMRLTQESPQAFYQLMEKLTQNTIDDLSLQKRAGIHIFQIFDTWAGLLSSAEYRRLVLPFVRMIFKAIDLPSIYYLRYGAHLLQELNEIPVDFLSLCHTISLSQENKLKKMGKGIQGNLFPGFLYAADSVLEKEVRGILSAAKKIPKYIFNLSQGVFPDMDVQKLRFVVEKVHSFKRAYPLKRSFLSKG